MEIIGEILVVLLFLLMLCCGLSMLMIKLYLAKRKLSPAWKLCGSFNAPWNEDRLYINSTKKEYGHTGIWFKIQIISFISMMALVVLLLLLKWLNETIMK